MSNHHQDRCERIAIIQFVYGTATPKIAGQLLLEKLLASQSRKRKSAKWRLIKALKEDV